MASNSTSTNGAPVDPLAAFPQIPAHNTLGAWLLGVAGSLLLNGMIFHQTFRYFRLFPNDRAVLRAWVIVVVVLETFTTILTLHTAYFYLVSKYWEPEYFFISPTVWSINLLPIPATIAALASQSFFARRVWMISPKFRLLIAVAVILISGNVVCFTVLAVKMFEAPSILGWLKFSWLASVGSSIQMAGDMMITATLIYVLRQSRTGINKTDSMLDLLVMYAVSTGLITCIVHILNVAFSIAYPDNFIYAALSCILTKLYANTFLVALNTRRSLASIYHDPSSDRGDQRNQSSGGGARRVHNMGPGHGNKPLTATLTHPTAIELKVVTEVITEADEMDDEALDMQRQMESKHSMQHPDGRGVAGHDMA
ncbi:hypothetical protein C8Q76DRAFT_727410 [Earliella scabrosa]|nr:hypothetical protein C8Q76DRAFT_727410 [Earliella scabrosa]